jgi:hypothetical protein
MDRYRSDCARADAFAVSRDGESGNILDNLLKRMEQYANNLEVSAVDDDLRRRATIDRLLLVRVVLGSRRRTHQ